MMYGRLNRRSLLVLATLNALVGTPASSQEPVKPVILDAGMVSAIATRLLSAAQAVASKFRGRPESSWVSQLADDAMTLAMVVTKAERVSSFYGEMLAYDAMLLEKAHIEVDWGKALHYVRAAYGDVGKKVEALKAYSSGEIDVPVEVNTVRRGGPVNNLLIHFYMSGLPDTPAPYMIFNRPTTPTEERVPPGRYFIHVLSSNSKLRLVREADVGGSGQLVKIEIAFP